MCAAQRQPERAETAWGKWVRGQPKGVLTDAMRVTGLSWSTVSHAQWRRIRSELAKVLADFTGGAVSAAELAIPSRLPALGTRKKRVRTKRRPRAKSRLRKAAA